MGILDIAIVKGYIRIDVYKRQLSYRAELDKSELFPANSSAAKVSSKRTV